jgi:hypothetical protein
LFRGARPHPDETANHHRQQGVFLHGCL